MAEPGRTESATPKKREEVRKKGQVARSLEINSVLNLLAVFVLLKIFGGYLFDGIKTLSVHFWKNIFLFDLNPDTINQIIFFILFRFLVIMLPVFLIVVLIGILSNIIQVGFFVTFEPLKPQIDNINPAKGFKRIFSRRAFIDIGKTAFKILIIMYILYSVVKKIINDIFVTPLMDIDSLFIFSASAVFSLAMKIIIAFLVFAIIDYVYQKWEFEESIKMTKQEVKDELKQLEGDPLIKARIRNIQREMARRRMISEIPQADVVITNPQHIAVAIKYQENKDNAPRVVAKGINYMAQRIKQIARENGIIIVENPPVARALYKLEIGWEIPEELFQVVAEILAFVYQAKGKIKVEEKLKKVDNKEEFAT